MHNLTTEMAPAVPDEQEVLEARQARLEAREARLVREREQAGARRRQVRELVAAAVRDSPVQNLPSLDPFVTKVRSTLNGEAAQTAGESTERAIFAYILEKLTDYDNLARMLNRLEAGFELSAAVRIYVCCRIIRHYRLALDPLEVAFPAGGRGMLPTEFASGDPEQVAAAIIGLDS